MTLHTKIAKEDIAGRIASFLEMQSVDLSDVQDVSGFPLLEGGALDSLGVLNLMMFLAEEYQLEIDDEDFTPENFRDVASLATMIQRKSGSA